MRRSPSPSLLLLGLVGGLVVLPAQQSSACSCGGGDPRNALEAADAAFTGSLIRREEPRLENGLLNSGQVVTWTFRVDQPLKGSIGPTIDVESPLDGAACGLEVEVGGEAGLLLWKEGGRWHSNLCAKFDPELLNRAAGPLPAPDGAGPVRLLAGGSFGEVRTIALDSAGRTLAYGFGEGSTSLISVCPGSERVAEIAADNRQPVSANLVIAVRDLPTLTIEWETEIHAPPNRVPRPFSATGLSCRNRDGTDLLVATHFRGRKPVGAIVRFRSEEIRTVYRGPADWVSFAPGNLVYVSGGRNVFAVDLHTGKAQHVPQAPPGTGPFAVSPNGDSLAAVVDGFGSRPSIILIDLRSDPAQVTNVPIKDSDDVGGSVIWLDDRRLLFSPIAGEEPNAHVYDASLRRVDTLVGWNADSMAVASGVIYGLGFNQLRSSSGTGHQVEDLRTFEADIRSIVAVPPAPGLELPIRSDVSPSPGRDIASNDELSPRTGGVWPIALVVAALTTTAGAWLLLRRTRSAADGS